MLCSVKSSVLFFFKELANIFERFGKIILLKKTCEIVHFNIVAIEKYETC